MVSMYIPRDRMTFQQQNETGLGSTKKYEEHMHAKQIAKQSFGVDYDKKALVNFF